MISGEPTEAPTCSAVNTPVTGKTAIGKSEVTGMGMGSKIHQAIHSQATNAVTVIESGCPPDCINHASIAAVSSPGHMVFLGSR